MERTSITATERRFVAAAMAAVVVLASCGDSTEPAAVDPGRAASGSIAGDKTATNADEPSGTTPTSTGPPRSTVTAPPDQGSEGGFGAPAAAPGEFEGGYPIAITGVATLGNTGCWYLGGEGTRSLLIAPEGTALHRSGSALVTSTGEVISDGDRVDAQGWFESPAELPGGPDGKWANYVAFCDPPVDAVITTSLGPAFDPATGDPAAYAAELSERGAALFDTHYGCGYGFTAGDRAGGWAVRIDTARLLEPPAPGPVTLPDDRFDAESWRIFCGFPAGWQLDRDLKRTSNWCSFC